ncbi:helix-turn-helix domain-containing protein [Dactylosporangium sp. CA-233914]|uniref:helix-turn-helix domain-containing protein n=1 Tax=Dactylosporangium sp. CA-233914 TaxID=3239934 RepID=UPI003D8B4E69
MELILDSSLLRPQERRDAVQAFVGDSMVRCTIAHPPELSSRFSYAPAGLLGVCEFALAVPPGARPAVSDRTERQAREDVEPAMIINLQVAGTSVVVQDGRETVLRRGEFALHDTTRRSVVVYGESGVQNVFRVTNAALALPQRTQREVTARAFGSASAVSALAADYLTRLGAEPGLRTAAHADRLAAAGVDLLRAALAAELADETLGRQSGVESLHLRIMAYLRENLAEPGLDAARVAAAHNISVRHLYVVLERAGVSLGSWIRTQRLEGARTDLARPGAGSEPIRAVARRWGFTDVTHFSRTFRKVYGMRPREWRDGR